MRESNENESVPPSILSSESFGLMQNDFSKNFRKNLDDEINKDQILQFLDYNSPNGKFDRNYANKMFDFLFNNPRDLTVKSFISNYLYSIEELKRSRIEFENKLSQFQQEKNEYQSKILNYKNEPLNEDGISPNSKLIIILDKIEFVQEDNADDRIYHFTLEYNNKIYKSQNFTRAILEIEERNNTFEFENIQKNDNIILKLKDSNDEEIRNLYISTDNLIDKNQEDFEINVGVENDEKITILNVYFRGSIIISYYNHYNNLLNQNQQQIQKYKERLTKTNETINTLTNLKCFKGTQKENQNNIYYNDNDNDNIKYKIENSNYDYNNFNNGNIVFNGFDFENIKGIEFKEIIILTLICILNMILGKTDLINFIICSLFIVYLLERNSENYEKNKNAINFGTIFGYIVIGSYVYDVLWFLFNISGYLFNGFINTLIVLNSILIIIGKIYIKNQIQQKKSNQLNINR